MTTCLRVRVDRSSAARLFAAEADKVAGERVVELRKVTPNDVRVERAQDCFPWFAIDEKPHHGLDAARRIGAKLRPALRLVGRNRYAIAAFSARVADDHIESEHAARRGSHGDRRQAHLLKSIGSCRSIGVILADYRWRRCFRPVKAQKMKRRRMAPAA